MIQFDALDQSCIGNRRRDSGTSRFAARLGAFGQPGVERVLSMLRYKIRIAMQQLGDPR